VTEPRGVQRFGVLKMKMFIKESNVHLFLYLNPIRLSSELQGVLNYK
jgi:hypothetical protein